MNPKMADLINRMENETHEGGEHHMSEVETPEQKQPEDEQKTGTDAEQKPETQDGGDSNTPPEQ